jgi:hypothetical protein
MRIQTILWLVTPHVKHISSFARTAAVWTPTEFAHCSSGFAPAVPLDEKKKSAKVLDVHIIAHTHDDTGYLSTVDEYYESRVRSSLSGSALDLYVCAATHVRQHRSRAWYMYMYMYYTMSCMGQALSVLD